MPRKKASTLKLSIKLRFHPTPEQAERLHRYFDKYAKIFNAASKRISEFRRPWHRFKERIDGLCDSCKTETPLFVHNISTGEKRCGKCYNREFGNQFIRKLILPSRNKLVEYGSVRRIVKLSSQSLDYYAAVDHALNHFESFKEQAKQKQRALYNLRRRFKETVDLLEGIGSPEVVKISPSGRQRISRYQLKEKYDKGFKRGYTLSSLERRTKSQGEEIKRREASLKRSSTPKLVKLVAKIWEGAARFDFSQGIENTKLSLKIGGELLETMPISAGKIVDKSSQERVISALTHIKEEYTKNRNKSEYSYILAKVPKGKTMDKIRPTDLTFYLQYTFSPETTETYLPKSVLGIDLGIRHLAVYSLEKIPPSPMQKPIAVKFEEGKKLVEEKRRRRYYLARISPRNRRDGGIKRKNKRLISIHSIDGFEKWIFHNISKQLVEFAEENKAIIAMENLEDIRRRIRYTGKRSRTVLSSFTQKKLRDLVRYKATVAGVPFIEVPPAETSKRCYICGGEGERPFKGTSELFHCNVCEKTFNANYNASRNIAAKGFKLWSAQQNKWEGMPAMSSTQSNTHNAQSV